MSLDLLRHFHRTGRLIQRELGYNQRLSRDKYYVTMHSSLYLMRNLIQNSTSTFACKFEGVMIYLLKYMQSKLRAPLVIITSIALVIHRGCGYSTDILVETAEKPNRSIMSRILPISATIYGGRTENGMISSFSCDSLSRRLML